VSESVEIGGNFSLKMEETIAAQQQHIDKK